MELVLDALEAFLNGCGIANECGTHFEALWRNITDSDLYIVGNPLNKVARIFVLDVEHLVLDLLHRHPATEDCGNSEVAAVTGIGGGHHVSGVEHLGGELGNGQGSVML